MNILGLIGFGYNPGAALIKDGVLVAHSEEERFTRFKGSHFLFPKKSMTWMLNDNGLSFDDIDAIAWAWDQNLYRFQMPLFFAKSFFKHSLGKSGSANGIATVSTAILENLPGVVEEKIKSELLSSGIEGDIPPIHFLPHHLCHAASSYLMSGYEHSNIIVIDGSGEKYCTSMYEAEGLNIKELEHIEMPNSLGWFYAAITEYLGFIPYRDEGKVMGLAAYGEKKNDIFSKFEQIMQITSDSYVVDPQYTLLGEHNYGTHFSDRLVELLGDSRRYNSPITEREKDIAYAAQDFLEKASAATLSKTQKYHTDSNLCVAGGVSLNCKMNGFLRQQPGIDNLFVQPSGNDAGSALGAALLYAQQQNQLKPHKLRHTYYGSSYHNEKIEKQLKICHAQYKKSDNIPCLVAEALSNNKIVGVYQGAAEFGARALGHRSILANPLMKKAKDYVNVRVKFRENWRPFCPSLLDEDRDKYIENAAEAPFMAVAYKMKAEWHELLEAVVHTDGSIRPQTVIKSEHTFMWNCINEFKKITGHSIVMNTSFNVRGQPIVESPEDAIACFFVTGLDAMAIGDFWLEKESI